jgi:hypothetical protein
MTGGTAGHKFGGWKSWLWLFGGGAGGQLSGILHFGEFGEFGGGVQAAVSAAMAAVNAARAASFAGPGDAAAHALKAAAAAFLAAAQPGELGPGGGEDGGMSINPKASKLTVGSFPTYV